MRRTRRTRHVLLLFGRNRRPHRPLMGPCVRFPVVAGLPPTRRATHASLKCAAILTAAALEGWAVAICGGGHRGVEWVARRASHVRGFESMCRKIPHKSGLFSI